MASSPPAVAVRAPATSAPRPRRRRRRPLDVALLVACPVAVGLIFLFWTGAIPGNYIPSPTKWTTEISTCETIGERLPVAVHVFPLWATVHVHWTASATVFYTAYGPDDGSVFDQLGTSGNASFVSQAFPIVFGPTPLPPYPPGSCGTVNVTTTWTYSIW
jgi:hypothetical protein